MIDGYGKARVLMVRTHLGCVGYHELEGGGKFRVCMNTTDKGVLSRLRFSQLWERIWGSYFRISVSGEDELKTALGWAIEALGGEPGGTLLIETNPAAPSWLREVVMRSLPGTRK